MSPLHHTADRSAPSVARIFRRAGQGARMRRITRTLFFTFILRVIPGFAAEDNLPPRPADALGGSAFGAERLHPCDARRHGASGAGYVYLGPRAYAEWIRQ